MNKIGAKGQLVIEKEIRDKLGVAPGSRAIQRVVNDHLEVRFVPAARKRSLYGILRPYSKVSIPQSEWHRAKEAAWASIADEWVERNAVKPRVRKTKTG
ncbi:MAG: AbrB/MazE/SpoVT family DNA-binding domain-containing protein [Chloroflexi bacterium]|nr:AbrB/MazE/SpoVT family DNA-binding domain-containing protein [Chloroflexota bacterium]